MSRYTDCEPIEKIACLDNIEDMVVEGVDRKDRPDFSDAYFQSAQWKDSGISLTEEELDLLTETYPDLLNEMANESLR